MVPDYRHASPPPVPDGHTVAQPPRAPVPPVTRAERVWAGLFVGLVLVLVAVGVWLR